MRIGDEVDDGFLHRVLPDGCMDLVVMQRGDLLHAVVRGPRDTPLMVPVTPGDRYWGARFWPDAGALIVAIPAAHLVGSVRPAEGLFGAEARHLAERLAVAEDDAAAARCLDAWLSPQMRTAPPFDRAVRLALLALHAADGSLGVTALASMVALSPRQLQRRFRAATRLTIKTYARIRRMRQSLAHLIKHEPRTWSQVAASLGYADHSHLINEFTRLAGARPSDIANYIAGIQHVDVLP